MKPIIGHVGETVEKSGNYVCLNCGHYMYYDRSDEFEVCPLCGEEDTEWELEE